MINQKSNKTPQQQLASEEKLFKLLESIDWKLWEMYNMLKDATESKKTAIPVKTTAKTKSKKTTDE